MMMMMTIINKDNDDNSAIVCGWVFCWQLESQGACPRQRGAAKPWPIHAGHSSQPAEGQKDAKKCINHNFFNGVRGEQWKPWAGLGISQSHPILPSYKKQGGASLEFYNHRANLGWRGFLSTFVTSGTSWYPLGYPHPLPTLFIASLNSLRNPWSFGSPFSLGHCQVSSRRDFGCSALTLLLMGDKSWLDLPGEIIFPVHHFVNSNCWEKPGRSLQNPSECVTIPTTHFWEANGIQPNIPSESIFLNQILAFPRYLKHVPHNHWKLSFGDLLPFCFVSNVSLNQISLWSKL